MRANPRELWIRYFTTSDYVKELVNKFGKDHFDVEYIELFEDPLDAYWAEQKHIMNLWGNPNLLNRVYQDPKNRPVSTASTKGVSGGWLKGVTGPAHPSFGKPNVMKGVTGESHPLHGGTSWAKGLKPWDHHIAKQHGTDKMWLLSGKVYDLWISGIGYTRASKILTIGVNQASAMVEKFKAGWNPYEDPEWLQFVKEN